MCRSEGVLLECSRVVIAADLAGGAGGVNACETGWASPAGGSHPFDANAISYLEGGGVISGAEGSDGADAFVSAYLAGLGWVGEDTPLNDDTR